MYKVNRHLDAQPRMLGRRVIYSQPTLPTQTITEYVYNGIDACTMYNVVTCTCAARLLETSRKLNVIYCRVQNCFVQTVSMFIHHVCHSPILTTGFLSCLKGDMRILGAEYKTCTGGH